MLRNLRIHQKFVAILLLPLVVLTVLAVGRIRSNVTESVRAGRVNSLVTFTVTLAGLAHELQRSAISRPCSSATTAPDPRAWSCSASWSTTSSPATRRGSARSTPAATAPGSATRWRACAGGWASWPCSDGRSTPAYTSLSRAKEQAAQERGAIAGAIASGQFQTADAQRLAAASALESSWLGRFKATATAPRQALYARTLTGPDVDRANSLQATALGAEPGRPLPLQLNTWFFATSATIDLLRKVEVQLADETASASRAGAAAADRRVAIDVAGIAVPAVILALCMVMAGSMARPLRRLERAALQVAERGLPGVIERLQRGELVDPDEQAPLEVRSKDEIGQVARAFNEVHRVATRVATEQAALRKSIGDLFHNLARRSQGLVDRQLELIDELERGEADPERLEELFRIDHLATRMRRNAENLVVLSGTEQFRRWSEPVPLPDVVEAAVAEVEEYARVRVTSVGELTLPGQAATDVAHLLAELVENATSFSPPSTVVEVVGGRVASGYVLEIEDRGLGMTDADLIEANERLAAPSETDITASRMMGFHVVGRLAAPHGISVQLRHSWYGGVTALVLLPEALLARAFELAFERATTAPAKPREAAGVYLPLRRHAAQSGRAGHGDAAEAGEPAE